MIIDLRLLPSFWPKSHELFHKRSSHLCYRCLQLSTTSSQNMTVCSAWSQTAGSEKVSQDGRSCREVLRYKSIIFLSLSVSFSDWSAVCTWRSLSCYLIMFSFVIIYQTYSQLDYAISASVVKKHHDSQPSFQPVLCWRFGNNKSKFTAEVLLFQHNWATGLKTCLKPITRLS